MSKRAPKKVAIFDIDGTIFRSSLLIEIVEGFIEEGVFEENVRAEYEKEHRRWLERKGDYDAYLEAVVKVFMKNIKGVSFEDFDSISRLVVSQQKDRVYRYTRDLIKDLKKRGYYLLAISQSPKRTLDLFGKRLGFDKIYGRLYELGPSQCFTGKIVDEHLIENKANIVKRAVEKEGLTLKRSIGVGDTDGDISFLELMDQAICFNPNKRLYRYAKLNGWKVVVERKDVIYELS